VASRLAALFTDDPTAAASATAMLRLPLAGLANEIAVTALPHGAVAVAQPSAGRSAVPLQRTNARGRRLWVVGVPIAPGGSVDRILDRVMSASLDEAIARLTSLDGAFAAFVWDAASQRFVIVTDFAGMQPLYVRRISSGLAFATTIGALAALAPASPDPTGWGAFIGLGHFVGDRTSVSDVRRVDGASLIEYAPAAARLSPRTYWRWPEPQYAMTKIDTGELLAHLAENIDAYAEHRCDGTLLLSGGFESRLLAGMLARAAAPITALSIRNPYEHHEIDGRFARRVARELDIPLRLVTPSRDFFRTRAFLEYVRASDVATTSVNLFIAQVCEQIVRSGAGAVWDGVGYGIVVKDKSAPDLDAYLRKAARGPQSAEWIAARRVFSRAFVDAMTDGLADAVRCERERCIGGPAGVAQFFVRNRARNRTTPNALKVYAQYALPLMPGFTKAFYNRATAIPPAFKKDDALYRLILERHFPRLAQLPFCSGGQLLPGAHGQTWMYRLLAARSRIVEHPRIGHWLRRAGLTPMPAASTFVSQAVRDVELDDPTLNADGIRELRGTRSSNSVEDSAARELVFYWWAWQSAMRGQTARSPARAI
jgi:hypothetical protein